jgi:hypothetical protein
MTKETLAPVLKIGDVDRAIAWYHRLGFDPGFEHSSGPAFSRTTVVVKRGDLILILSNRQEDTPGAEAVVHLRVADVEPIANQFAVPVQTLQDGALVGRHIDLRDPDGNRIRVADLAPAPKPWSDFSGS